MINHPPSQPETYAEVEPVYEVMPGWLSPTQGVRTWADLPVNAQAYVNRLAELCGAQVSMVSVGPGHDQIIEVIPVL